MEHKCKETVFMVSRQLMDMPTRRMLTRGLVKSRSRQLQTGQLTDASSDCSSRLLHFCRSTKIVKCLQSPPLPCAREVGDADDEEKIHQQNIVSFSVIGELTSPHADWSAT